MYGVKVTFLSWICEYIQLEQMFCISMNRIDVLFVTTGHQDVALSPVGIQQARLLALRLQHVTFSHMFASDLSRAAETAKIIAEANTTSRCSVLYDKRLRERVWWLNAYRISHSLEHDWVLCIYCIFYIYIYCCIYTWLSVVIECCVYIALPHLWQLNFTKIVRLP